MAARTEAAREQGRDPRAPSGLSDQPCRRAASGFLLFLQFGAADGLDWIDIVRAVLILLSTFWLAWGAAQGLAGPDDPARGPRHIAPRPIRGAHRHPGAGLQRRPGHHLRPHRRDGCLACRDRHRRDLRFRHPVRHPQRSHRRARTSSGSCGWSRTVAPQGASSIAAAP